MPFQIRSWHLTDVGCVRDHNEDNGYADPEGRFFICSDGMGGHASGDIASAMAVQEISSRLAVWPAEFQRCAELQDGDSARAALAVIEQAVRATNEAIHRRGRVEPDKRGMGCTVDVVVVVGNLALCAHVGDSRNYLIRDGKTQQLTQDHSMAPPRMPGQPQQKGMLTSALGPNPTCRVDTFAIELREGDRILLCTDGLADYFGDEREIGATIAQRGDHPGAAWLVEQAKARGGADNITIVLIKVDKAPEVYANMPLRAVSYAPPPAQDMVAVSYAQTAPGVDTKGFSRTPPAGVPGMITPSSGKVAGTIGGGVTQPIAVPPPPAPPPAVPLTQPAAEPGPPILPPGQSAPRGSGASRADADEITLPEALAGKIGVFTTSPLFNGVAAELIKKLVAQAQPRTLNAGLRVPRVWNGADTAWLILEGEYRGMLLYPEALMLPQGDFPGYEAPEEDTPALPLTRMEVQKFCNAEPAAGVKLLQNLGRLIAQELKDTRKKLEDADID